MEVGQVERGLWGHGPDFDEFWTSRHRLVTSHTFLFHDLHAGPGLRRSGSRNGSRKEDGLYAGPVVGGTD